MISDLDAFKIGLLALAVHIVLTTFLIRLQRERASVLLHILSAAVIALALLLTSFIFFGNGARFFWIVISVLYGGAIAFLFLFSAVHKSISLEVLCELSRAPQCRLEIEAIAQELVLPRFVERIELLIAGGLAVRAAKGFVITDSGQKTAHRLRILQRVAGVTRSGLYGHK
jgi:hypothetical protein